MSLNAKKNISNVLSSYLIYSSSSKEKLLESFLDRILHKIVPQHTLLPPKWEILFFSPLLADHLHS